MFFLINLQNFLRNKMLCKNAELIDELKQKLY